MICYVCSYRFESATASNQQFFEVLTACNSKNHEDKTLPQSQYLTKNVKHC
ncbi:hypothetical protein KM92DES2_11903 [uncultured Desulfovibrio sp.]|uniref:Uncharacterized protein n=1 Tax=uncultured Desulfovibrio sp. TaxID=167968 RepID=A0A212JY38_9BACT|nr:hypothetical protein KM92DES2_11903 [uncultured Desulfovibrio sp.]